MRRTLSLIKAAVGSFGGHTKPSARVMASTRPEVEDAYHIAALLRDNERFAFREGHKVGAAVEVATGAHSD